jgi:Tol biopolymer transport system component
VSTATTDESCGAAGLLDGLTFDADGQITHQPDEHLFVLHADGSEKQVTEGPMSIDGATISPDGSRVVFAAASSDGGAALYAVDAQGGSAKVLIAADGCCQAPAYAPDGTRIAYISGGGDHSNSVWLMNADGSDAHPIVRNESHRWPGPAELPYWSPDGSQIAYTTGCLEGARAVNREGCHLAIADADSSNVLAFGSAASGPWHP